MGVHNMESMNGQEIFTGNYGIKEDVDMVNHPPHYNKEGIECIDAISAALGPGMEFYLQGNIMKYLWRYRYKGS